MDGDIVRVDGEGSNFPPEMCRAIIYNLEVLVRKDSPFLDDDEP